MPITFFFSFLKQTKKKSHPETKPFTRFVLVCFFMFLPEFLILLCQAISTSPITKQNKTPRQRKKGKKNFKGVTKSMKK